MKKFLIALFALLLLGGPVAGSDISDRLQTVSWQLYVKEWGKLTAICSAGAYYSDGKFTRLLTASHCITLTQLDSGKTVPFMVTQSGNDFKLARVLATGWRIKGEGPTSGKSVSRQAALPSPGFLAALQLNDAIDIDHGDWAILEIDGAYPTAPLGDSAALREDDFVFAFGYPLGGDRFFSRGYIANVKYQALGTEWADGYIAADITAAPGNSGSLVVNERGEAVAILVAGAGDRLHILTPVSLIRKQVPCLDQPVCKNFVKVVTP